MTTSISTSNPTINISPDNVYGDCDLKCAYNFKYNQSNSVATNNGVFISLSYDKGATSPVVFNTHNYSVSKINIYSPSLHTFNDSYADAELVIEHTPEMGGDLLYVCIPIISSTNSSDASTILSNIIQNVSNNAPAENETTNLNLSDFNLNTFVPQKSFFSYTGTVGLVGQVIVFGNGNAIPLKSDTLTKLSKIINPYPITISGGDVFLNSKGPNNSQMKNDGIYISCQPTGSSEEEIDVTTSKNSVKYDLNSIVDDPTIFTILQILIFAILFIVLFFIVNYAYNYFYPNSSTAIKLVK